MGVGWGSVGTTFAGFLLNYASPNWLYDSNQRWCHLSMGCMCVQSWVIILYTCCLASKMLSVSSTETHLVCCVCAYMCVCVCVCVCVHARVCVHMCVHACMHVCARVYCVLCVWCTEGIDPRHHDPLHTRARQLMASLQELDLPVLLWLLSLTSSHMIHVSHLDGERKLLTFKYLGEFASLLVCLH